MAGLSVEPNEIIENGNSRAKTEGKEGERTPNVPALGLGRPMTDDEFQGLVFVYASDSREYTQEFLAQHRYQATEYYKGRMPDIDAEDAAEDRSTAVMTAVRDTVLGIMPDLLRIFFSCEGVCKYDPVPSPDPNIFAQNAEHARSASMYVQNTVLKADNPDFFTTMYDAFQDALVRKTGFVKWWWERSKKPIYSSHTGLTEQELMALASDNRIEILGKREYEQVIEVFGQPPQPIKVYDVQIRHYITQGRLRIRGVPCENVIVARRGTAIDKTSLFGFTEDKQAGDFLAEGWIDDLTEIADCDRDMQDSDNYETQARRPAFSSMVGPMDDPAQDPAQRTVKYGELYIRADRDGDGIAELIRVITAGIRYKILHEEPVDDIDYAAFCPYPEAYQFFGESVADLTMDIQRIQSRMLRDTLDSLAQSVEPQVAIVEGKVNLDDVLNPDTSKVIRQQAPGMVQPITTPFVGKDAIPAIEFMNKIRENRTGQSDASNGLDPSVMQSSTQSAVHATLTKAQSRVEMIARLFAEQGMKRMFRGILRTLIKNQDEARCVLMMGKPCIVDPRHWNAEMNVQTTLTLGRGSQQDQIAMLVQILQKQEQLLMELGPQNPVVDLDQYCYTLQKLVELAGWQNTQSFFHDTATMNPQAKQAAIQQMTQAQAAKAKAGQKAGPDPQIEQMKIQSNERIEQQKMQLEAAKHAGQMELEKVKLQGNLALEAMRMKAQSADAAHGAMIDAAVTHHGNQISAAVDHHNNLMSSAMEKYKTDLDHEAKKYAVDNKPAPKPAAGAQ